jgi:hypothetical protein
MQRTALIGYTGFVGSNLANQARFTDAYNSKNIETMRGLSYDLVVCAGAPAGKWLANKQPDEDRATISRLVEVLRSVHAKRFVLISTVDVYPVPVGVDENTSLEGVANHAYGSHRYELERAIERFEARHVLRLPGLFGRGLKKNVIFDLLNDNCLDVINPTSVFQYYDLSLLWDDIQVAIKNDLSLLNFATEPIETQEIVDRFFPGKVLGQNRAPRATYDMRSIHAGAWGNASGYLYDKAAVLSRLKSFIAEVRGS